MKYVEIEDFGGNDEFNAIKTNSIYILFYKKDNNNNWNIYNKIWINIIHKFSISEIKEDKIEVISIIKLIKMIS